MCDVFASYSPILTEQTEDGKFAVIFSNSTRGASLCTGIVYQADEASLAQYMSLRKIVQDRLDAPLSIEDASHVTRHSEGAMRACAAVMLSDRVAECKYASASILLAIEYLIYLANKSYLRRANAR